MSKPVKIFDPDSHSEPMRLACFMSGSGTNVVKILENQSTSECQKYRVVLLFSDNDDSSRCNARKIAESRRIPVVIHDIANFYVSRGQKSKRDLALRAQYDSETVDLIDPYKVDVIALGGYMSILTQPILDHYPGKIINVHPGDLSIRVNDRRRFVGLHAVRDAILAGESRIFSTTHIVRKKVDNGEILMRSKPVKVILPRGLTPQDLAECENRKVLDGIVEKHQARLKELGDWIIFPRTLKMIGEGRFALDGKGNVYLDNTIIPNGLRL